MKQKTGLLSEVSLSKKTFNGLDAVFRTFEKKTFLTLPDRKRSEEVNRALLGLIQKEPEPCFLLSAVLEFVERVDREDILHHYTFNSFELWLNQCSGLGFEENYRIRAKIAGKFVPRSEYQAFFPIGMGKIYEGTHFVTAHKSPDLDTTVASFWGWVDAFAARVGEGMHVWNVPGGPPASQIEIDWMFRDLFGPAIFTHLAKMRTLLNLTGNDLMTQKGMLRKPLNESITGIDHDRDHTAIVLIDEEGIYLGDWRNIDVEGVRQVILMLSSCLRWFENTLHLQWIALFAKKELLSKEVLPFMKNLFNMKIRECEPAHEFTHRQKQQVEDFLTRVLGVKKGLDVSFEELGLLLAKLGSIPFHGIDQVITSMQKAKLFDSKGHLLEDRPPIFAYLEKAIRNLHSAILSIRSRLERLDIALKTKSEVFGHHPTFVTVRADVEEIKEKMSHYPYLTVNYPAYGKLYPVGVIQAPDLRKSTLGTVSLRDFCNRDEMGIPPYLEVISVIDHHKSSLSTLQPPFAIIADAQSCNSLVAKQTFLINDRYTLLGQAKAQIQAQLDKQAKASTPLAIRLTQRLLQRRLICESDTPFYVHPDREYIEYLQFLHAILDDTDLLSKVSAIDVECVTELLNRMKTLATGRECEIVSLDDLPRDSNFPKKAAQRLLQNEDLYSLYKKVYAYREKEVEQNMRLAAEGKPSNVFADTKEQNGCCRVGQTKIFSTNVTFFEKKADSIRHAWLEKAEEVHRENQEICLHLHMISTIVSADEVYKGTHGKYTHKDELWIWMAPSDMAVEYLKRFLTAFQSSPGMKNNSFEVEFVGDNAEDLSSIFEESFIELPKKISKKGMPIAIVRYKAGSLNSRKAMISPYLPTLNS
ncbi:MAG: hypothetical protein KGJ02_04435 [Verrucomicrobiota bacterium]|nr:hypothetical protein [Verrucomicrobiota bacterium]